MEGNGMGYLIVFLGAGIGGALRHGVNLATARLFGIGFPCGTLTVNIVGSLAMGLIAEYFALKGTGGGQHWRLFLATGVLGGFTTFSAFSLDAVLLYERGQAGLAAAYVLISVVASIAALFAGLLIIRALP
jgi:CrcB protein